MNALGQKIGLTNSHFGTANGWPDNGVTYVSARDLATLAASEIENHYALYKKFYSQPSFTWGKTLGRDRTSRSRTATRSSARFRAPTASRPAIPTRRVRLHRLGRPERRAPDRGRRRPAELECAGQESTRLIQWGFNAWTAKPLFQAGAKVGSARSSWAAAAKSRSSPRAISR
jgi:D-alanyl-D-alanine carboxypeptidase (penicillin-binding protein 5/6)